MPLEELPHHRARLEVGDAVGGPAPGSALLSSGQQWPIPVTVQNTTSTPSRQVWYVTQVVEPMLYVCTGEPVQPLRIAQPFTFGWALE